MQSKTEAEMVSGDFNLRKHRRRTTHLRNDDIDGLDWQLDILDLSSNDGDLVGESVDLDVLDSLLGDIRRVDSVDVLRSSSSSEKGEDSSSTSNVENDSVLEEVRVGEDEESVRLGSGGILEHDLVTEGRGI